MRGQDMNQIPLHMFIYTWAIPEVWVDSIESAELAEELETEIKFEQLWRFVTTCSAVGLVASVMIAILIVSLG